MVLKIGDENWHLHFHTSLLGNKEALWDVVVRCLVHTGPCVWTAVEPKYCCAGSVGVANCSKRDRFDGSVGSRLALTRAIAHLPMSTRQQIWDAYWQRAHKPHHAFNADEQADKLLARLGLSRLKWDAEAFQTVRTALANAHAAGQLKIRSKLRVQQAA